ncbi:MAG: protein kinase [Acidobacteriia bacterium]|nr:protein kinase [Terriglobia bacterium]
MPEISQTISHYTIVEKLGAGGMGEVYKARDTRLDRTVALKVLKSAAAPSADLRSRFEREAKAIAALNHPHICTLFDVGREGDTDFLVMEYCEGETLAQRLAKGPLPLEQVLRYGTEIAGALDKAHRAGIVHRDLKPGNIMITKSGVKLLDFGLAKLRQPAPATNGLLTQATAPEPLTAAGTILGTLHYMSPEQLEGKDTDARADIFALGTVLYEMVTGRKAFEGSSAASVVSAVMSAAPKAIASLQPLTPPALEHIVTTCLAKDPEDRRQSAADVARDLRWISERPAEPAPQTIPIAPRRAFGTMIWAAAFVIVAFLAGGLISRFILKPPLPPMEPQHFTMKLPADAPLARPEDLPGGLDIPSLAISSDGRRFAYVAVNDGDRRLYVRQIDEAHFRQLKGTEGATNPFFKPDGEWLGFHSSGKLKKVAFSGSSLSDICDTTAGFLGASWNRDGSIIFCTENGRLFQVREGEDPIRLFDPKLPNDAISFPRTQTDAKTVLAAGRYSFGSKLLDTASGVVQTIFGAGSSPSITPSGHLLAAGQGVLLAAPFDAKNSRSGDHRTVLDDLRTTSLWGAQYALSDTGTLLYAPGGAADEGKLVKVDRDGNVQDLGVRPGVFQHVSMDRDGNRVAVSMQEGGKMHVFVIHLQRPDLLNPLTSDGTINAGPIWSPQGDKIVFYSDRESASSLWVQAADGGAGADRILEVGRWCLPSYWSRDGSLIFGGYGIKSNWILNSLAMGSKSQSHVLWDDGSFVFWGFLSPNMRWLLYTVDKSGISQIFIRPWPNMSSPGIQISTQGGSDPLWSIDGREVFYRNRDQHMRVTLPDSLDSWFPQPVPMFKKNYLNVIGKPWDVMDKQHFIMIQPTHPDPPKTELYLIQNWFEELKRLVPIK